MSRRTSLTTVGIVALLAGFALHRAGTGSLASPPWGSWTELDEWYAERGPGVAIVAMLRLVALAASAWLCAASGLQITGSWGTSRRITRLADLLSPAFVRTLAQGAAGLSMTAGLAMPGLTGSGVGDPPNTAVMVPLDPVTTTTTTGAERPPTLEPTTTSSTVLPPPPPADVVPPAPAPVGPRQVVVAPGDSFWSIAEDEVGERELTGYWRALIEANRGRLVDPSNPDLLYPDQVLVLP